MVPQGTETDGARLGQLRSLIMSFLYTKKKSSSTTLRIIFRRGSSISNTVKSLLLFQNYTVTQPENVPCGESTFFLKKSHFFIKNARTEFVFDVVVTELSKL